MDAPVRPIGQGDGAGRGAYQPDGTMCMVHDVNNPVLVLDKLVRVMHNVKNLVLIPDRLVRIVYKVETPVLSKWGSAVRSPVHTDARQDARPQSSVAAGCAALAPRASGGTSWACMVQRQCWSAVHQVSFVAGMRCGFTLFEDAVSEGSTNTCLQHACLWVYMHTQAV